MKLKYMGLKPVISEHGISFKDGKEDKFVYLSFAIDILISINHTYEKDKKYSHNGYIYIKVQNAPRFLNIA